MLAKTITREIPETAQIWLEGVWHLNHNSYSCIHVFDIYIQLLFDVVSDHEQSLPPSLSRFLYNTWTWLWIVCVCIHIVHFKYRKKPASMNRRIFRVAGASRHDEEKDKTKEIKKRGGGEGICCSCRVPCAGWSERLGVRQALLIQPRSTRSEWIDAAQFYLRLTLSVSMGNQIEYSILTDRSGYQFRDH